MKAAEQLTLFKEPKRRSRKPKSQAKGYQRGEFPPVAPPDLTQESALWLTGQRSIEAQRGKRYVPASIKHPGKMQPDVAAAIIDTYTAPGQVILDCMAGIGTTLVEGAERGRHVIGIELVRHWANVAYANALRTTYRGAPGTMRVICGDARALPELLAGLVDSALFSPVYGESRIRPVQSGSIYLPGSPFRPDAYPPGYDATVMSPPFGDNIFVQRDLANMRAMEGRTDVPEAYDAALFSPPFGPTQTGRGMALEGINGDGRPPVERGIGAAYDAAVFSPTYGSVEVRSLPAGDVLGTKMPLNRQTVPSGYDAMIASPAYGDIRQDGGKHTFGEGSAMTNYTGEDRLKRAKRDKTNVGNLKYGTMAKALALVDRLKAGETIPPEEWPEQDYLEAMALIYWHCLHVLRFGGLCILVLKDYRRKKRRVRLVSDTETLMEAVGFTLHDKALAMTSSVQSGKVVVKVSPFQRVNARKPEKNGGPLLYPAGEEVLVFRKEAPHAKGR